MKKILLVDDESHLLAALQRALRQQFPLEIACGGAAGLEVLQNGQDFSVVVSDMRMPGMNGVEFLRRVKEIAPDVVRLMLTGNADQATAIDAINEGNIFRFLNKPCSPEKLAHALHAAARQHQLITAERDLLENTLRGSINVLTEIFALAEPKAFGHAELIRDNLRQLAAALKIKDTWELEVAALLSHIGCVTIPPELLLRGRAGQTLSHEERSLFQRIPAIGGKLLAQIPRLEGVSQILIYQNKCFDGSGLPDNGIAGAQIPQGARMLKILCDLAELEGQGKTRSAALAQMRNRTGWYDTAILAVVAAPAESAVLTHAAPAKPSAAIPFAQLRVGHVLSADVETRDGLLVAVTGKQIKPALIERLRNFALVSGLREPLFVEA